MSSLARRAAVQKLINQAHEGPGEPCKTSAKGRGAARESGLSRSRKHASKRERGDVHRKSGHVPVAIQPRWEEWTERKRPERTVEGCTCHAQTASRPDTTMRRTPCPGEPRSALGTQTQHCRIRQWWIELRSRGRANPQMLANVRKKSLAEMDEHFSFTEC